MAGWRERWHTFRNLPIRVYPQLVARQWRQMQARRRWPPKPSADPVADLLTAMGTPKRPDFEFLYDFWYKPQRRFFVQRNARQRGQDLTDKYPRMRVVRLVQAEQVMAHQFDLLGTGLRHWGDPLRWRWDPVSDFEWPLNGDEPLVALNAGRDVKLPWELARMHHLVTLGQAFAHTGDARYVREMVAQLNHFWSDNPPGMGIHWQSAMEVAIRAVNMIWAFELVLEAKEDITNPFTVAYLNSLFAHGRFIYDHLEDYYPPNNHLLANLCGLVWLGLYLQPAPEAARWLKFALPALTKALAEQVLADGTSYESSTHYHWLNCEMVLWTIALCQVNEQAVPDELLALSEKMATALADLVLPGGRLPLFGDNDSGHWLLLADPSLRDTLALAAAVHRRAEWAPQGEHPAPLPLWVGRKLPANQATTPSDSSFTAAGWGVLRSRAHGLHAALAYTAGKVYPAGWGGHAHNDGLSFEIVIGDEPLLVDSGTLHYTRSMAVRNRLRSIDSHNTLQIDENEPNDLPSTAPFRLTPKGHGELSAHESGWAELQYQWAKPKVQHTRRFAWQRAEHQWLIADALQGSGEHTLTWRFRVHTAVDVQPQGRAVRLRLPSDKIVVLSPLTPPDGLRLDVEAGDYCPAYGVQQTCRVLVYSWQTSLPVTLSFTLKVEQADDLSEEVN